MMQISNISAHLTSVRLALLAITERVQGSSDAQAPLANNLWQISQVLIASNGREQVLTGLEIWLRLLKDRQWLIGTRRLCSEAYWQCVQTIMLSSSQDSRRLGLAILRGSILSLSTDVQLSIVHVSIPTFREDFARFATLYQAVTIDRYISQVQSCIADLDSLSKSKLVVRKS